MAIPVITRSYMGITGGNLIMGDGVGVIEMFWTRKIVIVVRFCANLYMVVGPWVSGN